MRTRQVATFEEPSWTLGLDWQITDDTLAYVVTRRGFAQGGFNNLAPPFDTFEPETLTDHELGLKKDWHFEHTPIFARTSRFSKTTIKMFNAVIPSS